MIQTITFRVLYTQFGSDPQFNSNLSWKLHALVYLFVTYQDAEASAQATRYKLVQIFAIYTLNLLVP